MRPGPLLTGLSLPRDLELLRDRASEASRRGEDLAPLYEELAETAPVALIDLTLGPKAMREAAAVRAALAHADALERHSPGMAPYRRLASLSPEAALDVLTVAVARHAAASWLIPFADKIEARPGAMQLAATRGANDDPSQRPTPGELLRLGYLPSRIRERHGAWFNWVALQGHLNESERRVHAAASAF
jgi:hypothetical protein